MQEMFALSKWIWIDYGIAGILCISALLGFLRGFVREFFAMLVWFAAIWASVQYHQQVIALLPEKITNHMLRQAMSYAILFFGVLFLGSLINIFISQMLYRKRLAGSDRLLGMGFGFLRGVILVTILIFLAGLTPIPGQQWWRQSACIPPFQALAVWLKGNLPPNLAVNINYS